MPRGHKKDFLATAARKFKCGASFVSTDGHDFLSGKDWKARVREMLERDGFMCRWPREVPTRIGGVTMELICAAAADHPHHIIHRSKGGSDDLSNLMSICFQHHLIAHKERNPRWSKKEPADVHTL